MAFRRKVENWTDATFDLHAFHVLLLRVLEDDIRQVGPRHQAFNVVRQMHHHAMIQQDGHCPLGGRDTWREDNVRSVSSFNLLFTAKVPLVIQHLQLKLLHWSSSDKCMFLYFVNQYIPSSPYGF